LEKERTMRNGTHTDRTWTDTKANAGSLEREANFFHAERKWCHPDRGALRTSEHILVSRWLDQRTETRCEVAITPADRFFIAVALKPTQLTLIRGERKIFDGIMRAGSLYVGAPSSHLSAQLGAPCDFLHLYVRSTQFHTWRASAQLSSAEELTDLVVLHDRFVEQIAKALIDHRRVADQAFTLCTGQVLAMHLARQKLPRVSVGALPKWRLRRVEDYIKEHFDRRITLRDLAAVAGLSRMHFAAQFRTATGYRPHDYVVTQRIEYAKSLLSDSEITLAEIALNAGFSAQAHFSTVFKRVTGSTPAQWRGCSRSGSPISSGLRTNSRTLAGQSRGY
jgi:AraC family transcriptional regulator